MAIDKIFRIVLLLKNSGRTRRTQDHFYQKEIPPCGLDDLGPHTGPYPRYLLHDKIDAGLIPFDTWRFLDVHDDILGDIYPFFLPQKFVKREGEKKGTLVLLPKKHIGGIGFAHDGGAGGGGVFPVFYWIPLEIPETVGTKLDLDMSIERETYVVFHHPTDFCETVRFGEKTCEAEKLEDVSGGPLIWKFQDNPSFSCTGGSTMWCDDCFFSSAGGVNFKKFVDFVKARLKSDRVDSARDR